MCEPFRAENSEREVTKMENTSTATTSEVDLHCKCNQKNIALENRRISPWQPHLLLLGLSRGQSVVSLRISAVIQESWPPCILLD